VRPGPADDRLTDRVHLGSVQGQLGRAYLRKDHRLEQRLHRGLRETQRIPAARVRRGRRGHREDQ
jgi:hypothetical protein